MSALNRSFLRRGVCVLLLLGLLTGFIFPCSAENDVAGKTLGGLIAAYMQKNGISDDGFAVSYYNTVTGETFEYNENNMMIAASTYKLPLNLYYYRMELQGEIEPDAYIPEAGKPLNEIHEESLVRSNNELSEGIMYHLGSYHAYKDCMLELLGLTPEQVDPIFYNDNYYCTHMMLLALRYLYEHAEDYPEMLEYMKQANPQNGFFRRDVQEIEIAHKFGSYMGAENDTGIFYTEQPFLLAVYTYGAGGENTCAEIARLVTDYNLYYAEKDRQAAEEAARKEEAERVAAEEAARQAEEEAERQRLAEEQEEARIAEEQAAREAAAALAEEQEPPQPSPFANLTWWMFAIAAGIFLIGSIVLIFVFSSEERLKKRMKKYDKIP